MTTIETPRSSYARNPRKAGKSVNWEKWGWLYMRASGVVLVVLIFGHLFVNMVAGEGVRGIDFAFVAGKWASPFWQIWDGLMLVLALIHGGNGMRTIINDYSSNRTFGRILKGGVLVAVVVLIVLGLLVITTFDPCPVINGQLAPGVPSFCTLK
jgi:succinate dehydrogenase / fumarate reductase membrane anchor subunit